MGTGWDDPYLAPDVLTTGTAVGFVTQRFNLATSYATDLWAQAQNLLTQLGQVTLDAEWDEINLEPAAMFGIDGLTLAKPTPPTVTDVVVVEPAFPYVPPDPVQNTLPARESPAFNVTDPGFAVPTPPDVAWPSFSGEAPYPAEPAIPNAPALSLPPIPTLVGVSIPSPPEYSIPEFNWDLPTEDLTAPEPQFVYNEVEYNSAIKDKLAEVLLLNLTNGGSGLGADIEQAIYDRARSRQTDEEQDAYDAVLGLFAGHGYMLPPGALAGQILEIENKILKAREDLNNDILVNQSKLAQENTHFIIDRAIANEQSLMSYINQFQTRALDAAKFVVLSAVEVYKVKVEKYKAQLAVYSAQAQVYTARIQGEIAKAEFYKAQIQGITASVEVQRYLIEAYKAQVQGVGMLIELYKSEMEGAKIRAEVDGIRIQSFAATVQAYAAQVSASTARFEGYKAQISGEAAKAEMYKAQVMAYGTRVEAYKAEVEADTLVLKQDIAINENQIEIFKARVQEFLARVQSMASLADSSAKIEGVKIDSYKAQVGGYASELDAVGKAYLGKVEEAKVSVETEVKEAELVLKEVIARQSLVQENIKAAAQIASQMAASAISGVNASANVGYGEQRSDSRAYSASQSYQYQTINSRAYGTYHNYNYTE
jgi:hypothetical protein